MPSAAQRSQALSCAALRRRCQLNPDGVAPTYHARTTPSSAVSAAAACWAASSTEAPSEGSGSRTRGEGADIRAPGAVRPIPERTRRAAAAQLGCRRAWREPARDGGSDGRRGERHARAVSGVKPRSPRSSTTTCSSVSSLSPSQYRTKRASVAVCAAASSASLGNGSSFSNSVRPRPPCSRPSR